MVKFTQFLLQDQDAWRKQTAFLLQKVNQDEIKAIFCDEFDIWRDLELLEKMVKKVDYLWIVPMTENLCVGKFEEWQDKFTFLDLSQNFRNSREIVKMAKSYAEKTAYFYKEGISMPPENFPTGCIPIFVDSFHGAMKEARKRTKDGILVITSLDRDDFDNFNQIKEKWKVYHEDRNDFKEEENPYKFLQEGNVLVIDATTSHGFEWTTVIIDQIDDLYDTHHKCNYTMRCTTNLIVVESDENVIRMFTK